MIPTPARIWHLEALPGRVEGDETGSCIRGPRSEESALELWIWSSAVGDRQARSFSRQASGELWSTLSLVHD